MSWVSRRLKKQSTVLSTSDRPADVGWTGIPPNKGGTVGLRDHGFPYFN